MDKLAKDCNKYIEKIKLLQNFITLSLRRGKVSSEIKDAVQQVEQIQQLVNEAQAIMRNELSSLKTDADEVMRRMRSQQSIILEATIKEKQRKIALEAEEKDFFKATKSSSTKKVPEIAFSKEFSPSNNFLPDNMQLNAEFLTPKITIAEYKESPLVKRPQIKKIPFFFIEFEMHVTKQQFESIPKYMRGRENVDELNNFLETIIVPCFNEKYQLLHRQRKSVRNPQDFELWKMYNDQASYAPGKNFITIGDIARKINKILDKKMQNRIIMLRHIGFLQEQRTGQTIIYICTANKF